MKVLWFSVTPAGFSARSNGYNGGGWIASLEAIVKRLPGIELAVAFYTAEFTEPQVVDGVKYFPIEPRQKSLMSSLFGNKHKEKEAELAKYLKVIGEFKPDVIQIFGSENEFGALCGRTDVPVVIHMQGCIPPYHNALFPIGMTPRDFITVPGLPWRKRLMGLLSERGFARTAKMEIETIQHCRYFMGRTAWDRGLVELFNPEACYFHCEEALRDSFISSAKHWEPHNGDGKFTIVSVISSPWYKGVDLILKTAKLLKSYARFDYEWHIYGVSDIRFYENKYKIRAVDVNVKVMGTASKDELVTALCSCGCYVHPSYIENSPNSLCEPQYLGVPVIATYVGGVPSIVDNGKTGLLVPANGPYDLASTIIRLHEDSDLSKHLGDNAYAMARRRHDSETIGKTILAVYDSILNDR